jgi:hypothetical protein
MITMTIIYLVRRHYLQKKLKKQLALKPALT